MPKFLRTIEQTTISAKTWSHDFNPELPEGTTLETFDAKVFGRDFTDLSADMVEGIDEAGGIGFYRLKGGVDGTDYIVQLIGTRSDGDVRDHYLLLRIRDVVGEAPPIP